MFDEYQRDVIYCNEQKVLLVDSPGSGKTTVIMQRLLKLIEDGINASNVLLITFTRKACENMKFRFVSKSKLSNIPSIYTFHGLFYKIISSNQNCKIKIVSQQVLEKFLRNVLRSYTDIVTEYEINSLMSEISKFNSSTKSIDDYETNLSRDFLKFLICEYEKFKKDNGLFDFDDLAIKVLELFKNNESILNFYRKKFKYILVDEFQDCDNLQFEILKMISEESNLFCVGDEDQSIYKFRGANPKFMVDFCNIFENGKKYYLKYNYMLTKAIVTFSRNIIENNKIRNLKDLVGKKLEEGEVICKKFLEDLEQGSYIVDDIKNLMGTVSELSNFAVLYRNHNDSFSVLAEFIKQNIKINFLDSDFNVFQKFYIRDIIDFILFVENPSIECFEKIYGKIKFLFSRRVMNILKKYDYNANVFKVIDYNSDKLNVNDKRNMYKLNKILNKVNRYTFSEKIDIVLSKLGYWVYIDNLISSKSVNKEEIDYFIKYFLSVVRKFDSMKEFNKKILSLNSIHGVNFGTMYASKGMEFKCVYIINAQNMKLDFLNKSGNVNILYDEEEERRIFYVGITRAIEKLRILSPYFINGNFNDGPLKFVGEGLKNFDYIKLNNDCGKRVIKSISPTKVLFYENGKKKKLNTRDYLKINN